MTASSSSYQLGITPHGTHPMRSAMSRERALRDFTSPVTTRTFSCLNGYAQISRSVWRVSQPGSPAHAASIEWSR